ncbi:MAG: glycosyltransferase family 2 protein [Rhodobacteraceae bacterium]|nr:glycosyltransferase family 2 protein [Paracoccaceae bacterium]
MTGNKGAGEPCISVIIPASNEQDLIGRCLEAVLTSTGFGDLPVEILVMANGCGDDTVAIAKGYTAQASALGWRLDVAELATPGKLNALNEGDARARAEIRAYLDADVVVSPPLLAEIRAALMRPDAAYASGRAIIAPTETAFARAYARFYATVPFMQTGVPGCGLFAVNAAGRARWGQFPDIISDDTFVRLSFMPAERIGVAASYTWPIVEGFGNMVRVRRRQDAGVAEIAARYPALLANDDKPRFGMAGVLKRALADPLGFAAYGAVALAVRLRGRGANGWERGR